jgi:hypothetical protein
MDRRVRSALFGAAITLIVLHAAFFYLPVRVSAGIFWPIGKASQMVSNLFGDRGTHGLGYFNPAIDLAVLYTIGGVLGAAVGWLITARTGGRKAS